MAEPVLSWREEDDGAWELLVDGTHFGVLCPHRPTYCMLVWDWGQKQNIAATVDAGKTLFERIARATVAGEQAAAKAFTEASGTEED